MVDKFKALIVTEQADGKFSREIAGKQIDNLPAGDVLINVKYSSLNYKDALSATGNRGVTKKYPHTPGIDAAGIVAQSSVAEFAVGDEVFVTGFDLGMNTSGGYQEYIRVPAAWVIKRLPNLNLKETMVYGTAGLTALLSVASLVDAGVKAGDGEVLVTGTTGGVGSFAARTLVKLGYEVVGVQRRPQEEVFLNSLGLKRIVPVEEVDDQSGRPLGKTRWAGVIDTVGGNILSTAIKTTCYGGSVTCCGNAASNNLPGTVLPFILRGVTLYGIDSVECPMDYRLRVWNKIAGEWKLDNVEALAEECSLEELNEKIDMILQGQIQGRVVVNLA
ncbi:MAG: YhdH/YhfP family quinone oxidoreductase [Syntrophomonadaceae bacterium]|nr:YhdH/YhfP family quinone oxidoreductase [Syntrophomonadaceae bacterium]